MSSLSSERVWRREYAGREYPTPGEEKARGVAETFFTFEMSMQHAQRLDQGLCIVFEGLDGAGKTTQVRLLYEQLQQHCYDVVSLKEPTDGPWGTKIRHLALHGRQVSPCTELEWFLQDRQENVAQHIVPALQRHHIVLLDRYYFSTMAYQGALGLDPHTIQARNEAFAPCPDLLFFLDIPPVQGLQRVYQRGGANAFERLDYLEQVARFFADMHFPYGRHLDATQPPVTLHATIWQEVQQLLHRHAVE